MHEFSLVNAIIDSIEAFAQENGWKKICSVKLKIGAMRQVVPDIMKFAFKAASEGTLLDGASLEIEEVPISIECPDCGRIWGDENVGLRCPYCGGGNADMKTGMELDIDSVEVDDDGEEED